MDYDVVCSMRRFFGTQVDAWNEHQKSKVLALWIDSMCRAGQKMLPKVPVPPVEAIAFDSPNSFINQVNTLLGGTFVPQPEGATSEVEASIRGASSRDRIRYEAAVNADKNLNATQNEIIDALCGLQSTDTIPWELCEPIMARLLERLDK